MYRPYDADARLARAHHRYAWQTDGERGHHVIDVPAGDEPPAGGADSGAADGGRGGGGGSKAPYKTFGSPWGPPEPEHLVGNTEGPPYTITEENSGCLDEHGCGARA